MKRSSCSNLRRSVREPELFADFYRDHVEALLGFFARRVYDPQVALDLAAETFAQAFISRDRFRGSTEEQASAWLYRIARRQLSRFFRRAQVERRGLERLGIEPPQLDDEQQARVEELADIEGLRGVIRGELGRLSHVQRQAVELRIVEELPYAELARRLDISEGTARVRVNRGLKALASALDNYPHVKEARA